MKLYFLLLLTSILLFAKGLDQNQTVKKIADDDKLVIVFTYTDECGWCERMKKETINYKPSLKKIKEKFMFTKINQNSGNIPSFLKPEYFPTTYILSTDGNRVLYKMDSYRSRKDFLKEIDRVYKKERRNIEKRRKSQIKDDEKLVLVFAHQKDCGWCERMQKETINYKPSLKKIKEKFMFTKILKESGNLPSFLNPELFPTTYILSTDGNRVIYTMVGYQSRKNFLKEISDIFEMSRSKE
jgi:thioredoxin-related protein